MYLIKWGDGIPVLMISVPYQMLLKHFTYLNLLTLLFYLPWQIVGGNPAYLKWVGDQVPEAGPTQ